VAVSGQQSSLKVTKAHLQNHLRQKEGDCNRMAVQIRVRLGFLVSKPLALYVTSLLFVCVFLTVCLS